MHKIRLYAVSHNGIAEVYSSIIIAIGRAVYLRTVRGGIVKCYSI